jgi:hypothetical protein
MRIRPCPAWDLQASGRLQQLEGAGHPPCCRELHVQHRRGSGSGVSPALMNQALLCAWSVCAQCSDEVLSLCCRPALQAPLMASRAYSRAVVGW